MGQLSVLSATSTYAGYFTNTVTTNSYGIYSTIADQTTGAGRCTHAAAGTGNTGYAGYFTNTHRPAS